MMAECLHPIFRYMGAPNWNAEAERFEQRHRCVDCGHEERGVPAGSVMIGHAPGECWVCDQTAATLPADQRERWINMTAEQRV